MTTAVGAYDAPGNFRCRACLVRFRTVQAWIAHLRESQHKQ